MAKGRNRTVYKDNDGQWTNKRNDATRASSKYRTQKEAQDAARRMLKNQDCG